LQVRYTILVQQHLHASGKLNAGPSAPLGEPTAFAATQAAWRFLHNDRVTLPLLAEPLHQVARPWANVNATAWALIVHDWSALSYPTHARKQDRKSHGSPFSQGYDLGTLLLVDGRDGVPVAPVEMELRTAQTISSTRPLPPDAADSRLDNVLPAMRAIDDLGRRERVIHVIDREADSLAHYRDWQADERCFLVRGDDRRCVRWQADELSLVEIQRRLQAQGHFRRSRAVSYRGQAAVQHVAETTVTLDRPAYRHRRRNGRVCKERVPGEPITLRLVVSRVCNARGETVAVWYLFSNAPADVSAATLALWYYWRWRIESFFKLLKSAGQAVEQWQQETGEAIAKRLLVAAMACTLVWKLERATTPEAIAFRDYLVRLSGRQMKHGKSSTAPAILAGLWIYLTMLDALEHHSLQDLQAMKRHLSFTALDTG
jgi:hypothetical protein